MSIATASIACLQYFTRLIFSLERSPLEHQESMPLKAVENENGRFKVWAGNLGALQKGNSSLDFRLRESSIMQTTVLKFLDQLRDTLGKSEWNEFAMTLKEHISVLDS